MPQTQAASQIRRTTASDAMKDASSLLPFTPKQRETSREERKEKCSVKCESKKERVSLPAEMGNVIGASELDCAGAALRKQFQTISVFNFTMSTIRADPGTRTLTPKITCSVYTLQVLGCACGIFLARICRRKQRNR